MRSLFLIFLLVSSSTILKSQNLVPNYSFEDTIICNGGGTSISYYVKYWYPAIESPDYFNICRYPDRGVPNNIFGYEFAYQGTAYTGIATYVKIFPDAREMIQVSLLNNLMPGKRYCIQFFVSLSDSAQYATNDIGAYFSTDSFTTLQLPPYIPQIINNKSNPLTNTNGWTKIVGSLNAAGGEKYITIGNFSSDSAIDTIFVGGAPDGGPYDWRTSYYYIDDVSVYMEQNADAGNDKTICKGDSIQIGTSVGYGLKYTWSTSEGLSDSSNAQPFSSPQKTTMYIVTITDTAGSNCIGKGSDTVTVYVKNVPEANSGSDSTVCKGKSIQLGEPGVAGNSYQWTPVAGLNSAAYAQPIASPVETTKYKLTVSDTLGGVTCSSTDSVLVKVEDCTLQIPTILFYNEQLEIKNLPQGSQLKIYNMLGQIVFTSGTYSNNSGLFFLSPGIYFYWLRFPNGEAEQGKFCVMK